MGHSVCITTPRLKLREWRSDEGEGFHRWVADPIVNHFILWAATNRVDSEKQLAEAVRTQGEEPRTKYFLALELLTHPGTSIGDAGFTWISPEVAEIGYFLEPVYWGKGLATEAAKAIVDFAFEQGATCVMATCSAQNFASEKVMKRCGMIKSKSPDVNRLAYQIMRGD